MQHERCLPPRHFNDALHPLLTGALPAFQWKKCCSLAHRGHGDHTPLWRPWQLLGIMERADPIGVWPLWWSPPDWLEQHSRSWTESLSPIRQLYQPWWLFPYAERPHSCTNEQFRLCARGGTPFASNEQCVMSPLQALRFLVILRDKILYKTIPFEFHLQRNIPLQMFYWTLWRQPVNSTPWGPLANVFVSKRTFFCWLTCKTKDLGFVHRIWVTVA